MFRRIIVSVGLTALLFGLTIPQASAYTLEGPRWPGQPTPPLCCASVTYRNWASDTSVWTAGGDGATAWNSSPAPVLFSTAVIADINYYEANDSSVSWDGLTTYYYYTGGDGKKYFSSPASVQVNFYYTKNYVRAKTQSVSAHEFGHALGLGHMSTCTLMNGYTSIRYSSSCGYIDIPQTDDVNGIKVLY